MAGVEQTPILNMELNRAARRIPTTDELHLAASAADIPSPPLPQKIQEMIAIKMPTNWNPFGEMIA